MKFKCPGPYCSNNEINFPEDLPIPITINNINDERYSKYFYLPDFAKNEVLETPICEYCISELGRSDDLAGGGGDW